VTEEEVGSPLGPDAIVLRHISIEGVVAGRVSVVSGLSLMLDAGGITVDGPEPGASRRLPWSMVRDLQYWESGVLPDGGPAASLTAAVGDRAVRWLIPTSQMTPDTEAALRAVVGRVNGQDAPPPELGGPEIAPVGGDVAPGEPRRDAVLPLPAPPASPAAWVPDPTGPGPAPVAVAAGRADLWPPGAPPPTSPPVFAATPFPAPVAPTPGPRSRRTVVSILVVLVVVLVLVGAALPFVWRTPAPAAGNRASPAVRAAVDRQVARAINITASDVPATWTVDGSPTGPLAGFLGVGPSRGGGGTSVTPSEQAEVQSHYESCMGVRASADQIFGSAGASPSAEASSPAYAAPDQAGTVVTETGSVVQLFASSADVATGTAQIAEPQFPSCFGAALAQLFDLQGGAAAGSGVGSPVATALSLPQQAGVHASGVSLAIPLSKGGQTTSMDIGFVLVGGGRAEAELFTFSLATPFPLSLQTSLTRTLESNVVEKSTATGA
jgi:hypothetical protein